MSANHFDETPERIADFLEQVPPPDVIRSRLEANHREAKLLRQLLRISEQRRKLAEANEGAAR